VKERVALKSEYVKPQRELFQIYRKEVAVKKAVKIAQAIKEPSERGGIIATTPVPKPQPEEEKQHLQHQR
jgi:hypothetical protein